MNILDIFSSHGCKPYFGNNAASSACPFCGGSTRVAIWPNQGRGGRYYCRKCQKTGDAVDLLVELKGISAAQAIELLNASEGSFVNSAVRGENGRIVDRALWAERASVFCRLAREILTNNSQVMSWLEQERGLEAKTIDKAGFGWVDPGGYIEKRAWGIQRQEEATEGELFVVPPGLLIPGLSHDCERIASLRVRRFEDGVRERYHLVTGSEVKPTVTPGRKEVIFIVESDLDAWLVAQEAGDLCTVVAMGSCTCRPDNHLEALIDTAKLVFVAFDNDEYGALNWFWWQERYKNARRWPIPDEYGKDPAEAFKNGLSVREWVMAALPPLLQPKTANSVEKSASPCKVMATPVVGRDKSDKDCFDVVQFKLVKEDAELSQALSLLARSDCVYIDTETYSEAIPADNRDIPALDPFRNRVRLITISDGSDTFIIDMKFVGDSSPLFKALRGKTWVGHNLAFDLKSLVPDYGESIMPDKCFDTMHAAELLHYAEDPRHPGKGYMGLAGICDRYLDVELAKELQTSDWSGSLTPEQLAYAAADVVHLPHLVTELKCYLEDAGYSDEVVDTEMAFVLERVRIELAGIPIDLAGIKAKIEEIKPQITTMNDEYEKEGINPRSPKMLAWLQDLGYEVESTSKDYLIDFAGDPVIDRLLRLREMEHQANYLESALRRQADGLLYPDYRQIGGPTGRMSCYGLNLQATPRALTNLFAYPPPGQAILTADLPAIEMRIAAVVADEEVLIDCFKADEDPHKLMASRITGESVEVIGKSSPERQKAKAANFGFLYGMGATTFQQYARMQGVEFSIEEAEEFREGFFELYPEIKRWHSLVGRLLKESEDTIYINKSGENVQTIIRESISGRVMKAAGYCSALNYAVQGTGADMIKLAAVRIGRELRRRGLKARIIHMVHDDLRVLCPAEEVEAVSAILTELMGKVVDDMLQEFDTVPEIKVVRNPSV